MSKTIEKAYLFQFKVEINSSTNKPCYKGDYSKWAGTILIDAIRNQKKAEVEAWKRIAIKRPEYDGFM